MPRIKSHNGVEAPLSPSARQERSQGTPSSYSQTRYMHPVSNLSFSHEHESCYDSSPDYTAAVITGTLSLEVELPDQLWEAILDRHGENFAERLQSACTCGGYYQAELGDLASGNSDPQFDTSLKPLNIGDEWFGEYLISIGAQFEDN